MNTGAGSHPVVIGAGSLSRSRSFSINLGKGQGSVDPAARFPIPKPDTEVINRFLTFIGSVLLAAAFAGASGIDSALIASGYVHTPMTPDVSRSLEAEAAAKPVLSSLVLHGPGASGTWSAGGEGRIILNGSDSIPALAVDNDVRARRAQGSPDDPDYALYGHASATLKLPEISLDDYNRLEIDIEPLCSGIRALTLNLSFDNSNGATGEGYNVPTGAHLIVLDNFRTNRCFLEIGDFRRDAVAAITLSYSINGNDLPNAGEALFRLVRVEAQKVADLEKLTGWQPDEGRIIYSMSGYAANGRKTALARAGERFRVVDVNSGQTAYEGTVEPVSTTIGDFGQADFSALTVPGIYRIEAGGVSTEPFTVGSDAEVWENSAWKVLNFVFGQRCGYAVPCVHSRCHLDLMSRHNGTRRSYAGGWHDAGDLSQQTLQTADVAFAMLELYDKYKDSNPLLASRLREEALWGIQFVLQNRLGDGYHASSVGLLIWQDGVLDSNDDIETVRVQNLAYDNYLYSAYEAFAARVLADYDPVFADCLAGIAREDYEFASHQREHDNFGGWINPYEHTYSTGESLYMATASWAASMLYELTADPQYAADASKFADYVLRCQQAIPVGGLVGFFYRNPQRHSVVHSIHQSREQIFMLAMDALCRTQPDNPGRDRWETSIALYGSYIKNLMRFTAPYGMIPAGIYRSDEPDDAAAFYALHIFPPDDARERFAAQAESGVAVAPGYFVRRFPVWFNIFNGNLAVHTSMGKAAAICARRLGDPELLDIAREQMYWTVGKNPFAQSLIYGEGHRYPELNNFSSGRLMGAMPVGIRTIGDTDEPYWPQINNACYKEVWLTSAGKWFSLIAEIENNDIS